MDKKAWIIKGHNNWFYGQDSRGAFGWLGGKSNAYRYPTEREAIVTCLSLRAYGGIIGEIDPVLSKTYFSATTEEIS